MDSLRICGGNSLNGKFSVQGSKNAVLPILAASYLQDGRCVIENCPRIADVFTAAEILEGLGAKTSFEKNTMVVDTTGASGCEISDCVMGKMRSSVMFLGAILNRMGCAKISRPGGCDLGPRPVDIHVRSLEKLGVKILDEQGYLFCRAEKYLPSVLTLIFPSVGATENLMLYCAKQKGETLVVNAAREPEIVDLQNFLNRMGADIRGAGSDVIRIRGVEKLHGCTYTVMPDRIAAATYALACTSCGGDILIENAECGHMRIVLSVLEDMGAEVTQLDTGLRLQMKKRPRAPEVIKTLPYPGFPTDVQPVLTACLIGAEGTTVISETMFENRYKYTEELLRMGADITIDGRAAIVRGKKNLQGAAVRATDLRGGAALVLAGLHATGESVVQEVSYIDRGYESIEQVLASLGGDIRREL